MKRSGKHLISPRTITTRSMHSSFHRSTMQACPQGSMKIILPKMRLRQNLIKLSYPRLKTSLKKYLKLNPQSKLQRITTMAMKTSLSISEMILKQPPLKSKRSNSWTSALNSKLMWAQPFEISK